MGIYDTNGTVSSRLYKYEFTLMQSVNLRNYTKREFTLIQSVNSCIYLYTNRGFTHLRSVNLHLFDA